MASERPLFVRKASGLVREMALRDIVLWNSVAQGIGIGALSFVVPVYLGMLPGANFLLGSFLAILGGVIITVVYAHFLSAMPRSGGEYVFLSRLAHPLVGFFFNFSMVALFLLAFAINLSWGASMLLPFASIFIPVDPFWFTAEGQLILGLILMVIALLVSVAGMRFYIKYQLFVTALSAIAMVLFVGVLVINVGTPANFTNIFNQFAAPYLSGVTNNPYNYVMTEALKSGYTPPSQAPFDMGQTVGMMVVFGFSGLLTCAAFSSYITGEMKDAESGKRQIIGLTGGLLLNAILLVLLSLLLLNVINPDWTGALYWLTVNNPEAVSMLPTTMLGFPFNFLEWLAPPAVAAFIQFTLIMLALTWAIMDLIMISRCMFAWAFDRLLPSAITHISPRFKTPTTALFITFVIGALFGVGIIYTEFWAFLSAAGWLTYTTYLAVGLTAIFFPFTRRKLYEVMPLKAKIGSVPVLSILGVLVVAIFLPMATVYWWGPAYAETIGVWNPVTTGVLLAVYIAAFVIYFGAKIYWKSKGIDLSLMFKEIPPA